MQTNEFNCFPNGDLDADESVFFRNGEEALEEFFAPDLTVRSGVVTFGEGLQGTLQSRPQTSSIQFNEHHSILAPIPRSDAYFNESILASFRNDANRQSEEPFGTPASNIIYVNSKQYRRILIRREHKQALERRIRGLREKQPYTHESRHRHAVKRPRGPRGRFLRSSQTSLTESEPQLPEV